MSKMKNISETAEEEARKAWDDDEDALIGCIMSCPSICPAQNATNRE